MAQTTGISWTDATWNPLGGCSEISPGCANCYAAVMAHRLEAMGQAKYAGTTKKLANGKSVWTGTINTDAESLLVPLRWKKPKRIFVNSMSDLFHEDVPEAFIDQVFAVMALCSQHTFQVLTKRSEMMCNYLTRGWRCGMITQLAYEINRDRGGNPEARDFKMPWTLPNVWLGVSVEDQQRADERIPGLLKMPAAVRFLSCEPLLGPVVLRQEWLDCQGESEFDLLPTISWVIVGGESGPHARPCDVAWIRSIHDQCKTAGIAFFCKQVGSKPISDHRSRPVGEDWTWTKLLRDRAGADPAEWPADLRVQEFPEVRR